MNFLILWFIFLMFMSGGFSAESERKALADDIDSGKLCSNAIADEWIKRGDFELNRSHCDAGHCYGELTNKNEADLYEAFIAKVSYERARLEMEMKGCHD